jgi:hypothetical protein
MLQRILSLFPPQTHPLTLVSDPDRLLAGETLMTELTRRGFQVIQEEDPVLLRHRIEEARPFTLDHPIIVTTTAALEDLPYDLYQCAYRINLSLHQNYPNWPRCCKRSIQIKLKNWHPVNHQLKH